MYIYSMKLALLIGGIVELLGGIICYFSPDTIFLSPDGTATLYGLAAAVIGLLCLFLYRDYSENRLTKSCYLLIMFFHAAIALFLNGNEILTYNLGGKITHGVLFAVFLIGYMSDLKPDNPTNQ